MESKKVPMNKHKSGHKKTQARRYNRKRYQPISFLLKLSPRAPEVKDADLKDREWMIRVEELGQ